jgi:hypothetical protein
LFYAWTAINEKEITAETGKDGATLHKFTIEVILESKALLHPFKLACLFQSFFSILYRPVDNGLTTKHRVRFFQ